MILLDNKRLFIKYFLCIFIVLLLLYLIVNFFYSEPLKIKSSIVNSKITYNDENTFVNVSYPRFKNDKIDKIITDYLFEYVKLFKSSNETNKQLIIDYVVYYKDKYANIVFNISNTIDNTKYKNIPINMETKELSYITNIFDKEYLEKNINEIVYYKYSSDIYDKIKNSNVNNHTYLMNDDKLDIYFYDIVFDKIEYTPNVTLYFNEKVSTNDIKNYKHDKFIAFTFDDGPSKYTEEILKTLEYNNATATFFMLGNRMKYNKDIVLKVYNSKNNIESHTYSHKNLTKINDKTLKNEVNSTNIIYNEITGDTIKFIRPPYGSYNKKVTSLEYPLILWSIDPKDWLYRDRTKVYNNVIKDICDGCIVLLHDIHAETKEAVKLLLPSLDNLGYNVVSVEELMKVKKYTPNNGETIRKIK